MADHIHQGKESQTEATGCGVFDFLKKNDEEKPVKDVAMVEVKKDEDIMEKLHRSDSNSSASSDVVGEEDLEGGEKKKKKEIKEKISGDKKEDPERANAEATNPEEKKGFLEKIKEKLPGQHKQAEGHASADGHHPEGEAKEKGILEKIKEKLPGYHKNEEEKKDH